MKPPSDGATNICFAAQRSARFIIEASSLVLLGASSDRAAMSKMEAAKLTPETTQENLV